jgi:hypothetical protein
VTIYAYVHAAVGKDGVEKQILATTYDAKYLPEGTSAVEFPDGTPLALVNGVIQPQYGSRLEKAVATQLSGLKTASYQAIENGFNWNGNQITLSSKDQANNQLSLTRATLFFTTAKGWTPATPATFTNIISAGGTYWGAVAYGTTGATEPAWSGAQVTDGSVTWQEAKFQVGTSAGNIWVTVPEAIELGNAAGTFVSAQRLAYQATKAKLVAFSSLPEWSASTSYGKATQIFVPTTGGVWTTSKAGKSGSTFPLFEQVNQVISDGTTVWTYVGQAETLVTKVNV